MALRLFTVGTGWEQARRDVRHAGAALAASGEHAKLAGQMAALLKSWKAVDDERIEADDAVVEANAEVRFYDAKLDLLIAELAARALADHRKESPEYLALFPDAPTSIVRLGLESEIARVKKFEILAKERKFSKGVQETLKNIAKVAAEGTQALQGRVEAAELGARVALRIAAWKEDANGARRSVALALDTWALSKGLGRDYSSAFFPAPAKTTKTKNRGSSAPSPVAPATPIVPS